jgi:serine protease Do
MLRYFTELLASVLLVAVLLPLPTYGQAPPRPAAVEALSATSEGLQALSRQVRGAIVEIEVSKVGGLRQSPYGRAELDEQRSGGSGFIVDADGYIITNAHVVAGANQVRVQLATPPPPPPGEESILRKRGERLEATVVGIDTETDVAVLKVPGADYPTLPFGDSDALRSGQLVVAFGAPMGLSNSASLGVVSATARQMQAGDPMIYVQTDASINPGSSGGPLVNTRGEVVGINTFIVSNSGASSGVGFAGPSNIVNAVYEQIRAHGRVRRGIIGVNAQTLTRELTDAMDIDGPYRVILADVLPGSPAERAGLRAGDIITRLNGKPMRNGRQFHVNIYGALGSLAQLEVVRGDTVFETGVRVVQRDDQRAQFAALADPQDHLVRPLGILALPLTDRISSVLTNRRLSTGAVVAASNQPPTPWGDRLQVGDVIYTVDGQSIDGPERLRTALEATGSGTTIVAHVLREGTMRYLVLRV